MLHKVDGVKVISPDVHTDYRGDLWTIWKDGDFDLDFNHDKISTSRHNVLRGIHGDYKSWKLVTCLYGSMYFVVVDNRPKSNSFIKWDSMILDDRNRNQVLIPPGVGNGHYILSDHAVFHYKWSYDGDYPDVDDQFTIKWDDQIIGVNCPSDTPILSERDKL